MTRGEPLVTVVICTYNAGTYLRPSVESILAQTYKNIELLIINDGSTDGSVEAIRTLSDQRMRIIDQKNTGKATALNVALEEMRGAFYAIQDADDISYPHRISTLIDCAMANSEVAAVFSGYDIILDGCTIAPRFRSLGVEECRRAVEDFKMPSHDPTAMYRMSKVKDLRYEPSLVLGEGMDYILQVGERSPMIVVGENLYSYRVHGASITKARSDLHNGCLRNVLKRACARRGLQPETMDKLMVLRQHKVGANATVDNNLAAHFIESTCDLRAGGRVIDAITTGLRCAQLRPLDLHYYKALACAVLPAGIIKKVRRSERRMQRCRLEHPINNTSLALGLSSDRMNDGPHRYDAVPFSRAPKSGSSTGGGRWRR